MDVEIRRRVDQMLATQLDRLTYQWWCVHEDPEASPSVKDAVDSALWEYLEQVVPLIGREQEQR